MSALPNHTACAMKQLIRRPMHRAGWCSALFRCLVLLLCGALAAGSIVRAGPAAGTAISNTAVATYVDGTGQSVRITSNTVTTVVQPLEALILTPTQSINRAPGAAFTLAHVLTNTGNVTTTYALTVTVSAGAPPNGLEIIQDLNGNGIADPGEPVIPSGGTLSLAARATANLLIAGTVPTAATVGQSIQLHLTATSQTQAANAANLDTIVVSGGPLVSVTKSASVTAAAPNANVSYTLLAQNNGSAAANAVSVSIDGSPAAQFVLRDAIPANTTFAALSSTTPGAHLLFHQLGDPVGAYVDSMPLAVNIDAVAASLPELPASSALSVTLSVTVHGNAAGTLANTAYSHFSFQGSNSTSVSNTVQLPLPVLAPTVSFYTSSTYATPAQQTPMGVPLFVQFNAAQCNTDPTAVLTHPVTLASQRTGDTETFTAVETAANSGIFRVQPNVPTASAATHAVVSGDGILETVPDDQVSATLSGCGATAVTAVVLVDPSGVVFDSKTNATILGATVQLIDVTGAGNGGHPGGAATVVGSDGVTPAPSTVTTAADGRYSFPQVTAGTYRLLVTPPAGYAFPSKLPPALLPANRNINVTGSFGGIFALTSGNAVTIDVPLDTGAAGGLFLQKVASKSVAQLGDFVDYTITITDNTAVALAAAALSDALPAGFVYVKGSARLNDVALPDPRGGAGPQLQFEVGAITSGTPATLSYRVHIGPGAQSGSGVNTAQLKSGAALSNIATASVQISGGVLSENAYIFGKVFADCNHDRIQNADEYGIPGVRIYLDDGTYAITDAAGKYSLYGLTPRTHVAKLDLTTLPTGAHLEILDNRNAQDPGSLFVDLRNGELHKADFAISDCRLDLQTQIEARRDALSGHLSEIARAAQEKIQLGTTPTTDARTLPASGLLGATPTAGAGTTGVGAAGIGAAGGTGPSAASVVNSLPPPAAPVAVPVAVTAARAAPQTLEQVLRDATPDPGFIDLVDGEVMPAAQTRVRVKGPLDAQLRLIVNGDEVAIGKVGEQSRLESRGISAWEYVGIDLKAGKNELTLNVADGFGNTRASSTVHVVAPGNLAQLRIALPETMSADTGVPINIAVELLDAQGVPVTARTALTLETTLGEWQTPDLDPREPGTQVFVEGGVGHFALMPPAAPGKGRIRISSGAINAAAEPTFLPNLRPMIAAGIVEGTIGLHSVSSNSLLAGQGTGAFEREIQSASASFADGKGDAAAAASVFLKGEIPGSNLLTLSYDSDKSGDTTLLRDIQPDRFYPVYGDSSIKGFDAQATSKLYARIDHGTSNLLLGDFSTQSDNIARQLSQYNRVLNGAKTHVEDGAVTVDAFLSDANTTQVIDEIPANGTSGPYHLSHLNLAVNSQQVDIITRDRDQPSLVLSDTTLTQFTDYAVEPELGEILFKAPVPSLDANLNPIYIRVTYEVGNGGPAYWVGGIDVRDKLAHHVTVGGTFIHDSNAADRQSIDGLNFLWQPNASTSLVGEVADTQSDLVGSGEAHRIEFKHNDPTLQARVYAVQTDATFNNPNSTDTAGASEYGAKIGYLIDPKDRLIVDALRTTTAGTLIQSPSSIPLVGVPQTITGGAAQNGENVAIERSLTKTVKLTLGVRHVDANALPTQPLAIGAVPDEFTSARVRLDAPIPDVPKAAAFAQYEEALDSTGREAATVGGTYQLGPQSKLYATHETSDSLSGSYGLSTTQQNYSSVVGIDTSYMKDGQVFNEYRVGDGIDGRSDEAALGLRNLWHLAPGLAVSTSLQQIHPISGVVTNEATAIATALEYTASPNWKGSTRVEWSESSTSQTWLTSAAAAAKLDENTTLLARGIYNEEINTGPTATGIHLEQVQTGVALRPVSSDVWNALSLIEYKVSTNTTLGPGLATDERAYIFSNHLNYQPSADWVINGRYGIKWARDFADGLDTSGVIQLLGARSVWDLDPHWDVGVQCYTELSPSGLGGRQLAIGGEVGYLIIKNVWLSLGYNIEGFRDSDLAGEDYTQRSFYVRLRFKFDETLFKPSNNAEPIPASVPIPP